MLLALLTSGLPVVLSQGDFLSHLGGGKPADLVGKLDDLKHDFKPAELAGKVHTLGSDVAKQVADQVADKTGDAHAPSQIPVDGVHKVVDDIVSRAKDVTAGNGSVAIEAAQQHKQSVVDALEHAGGVVQASVEALANASQSGIPHQITSAADTVAGKASDTVAGVSKDQVADAIRDTAPAIAERTAKTGESIAEAISEHGPKAASLLNHTALSVADRLSPQAPGPEAVKNAARNWLPFSGLILLGAVALTGACISRSSKAGARSPSLLDDGLSSFGGGGEARTPALQMTQTQESFFRQF